MLCVVFPKAKEEDRSMERVNTTGISASARSACGKGGTYKVSSNHL